MQRRSERYTLRDLDAIYEETNNELKKMAASARGRPQSWIVRRAKGRVPGEHRLNPTYLGVTKGGIIQFVCDSGTYGSNRKWYQSLKFEDIEVGLELLREDPKLTHRAVIGLLQTGDLMVHCDDPSWKYWGYQYIGTRRGYSMKKERRFPKIRNPRLEGSVCKHLFAVLDVLPFHTNQIIRDMRKIGLLDTRYKKKVGRR